jgi:hypothetical protein
VTWFWLALAGCQPGPTAGSEDVVCYEEALAEGEVYVGELNCREERFGGSGEGRSSDLLLANSQVRAIVRHPVASLSVVGVGGGSVIDFAPWGFSDRLIEAVLLVGGGGLSVDEMAIDGDSLTFHGDIVAMPYGAPEEAGRGTVTWRLAPDASELSIEGADGLYLHVGDEVELLSGQLVGPSLTYGHNGDATDLGGAVRIEGATRLVVGRSRQIGAQLWPDGAVLSGTTEGDEVEVLDADGQRIWAFAPNGGSFDTRCPPGAVTARALSEGRRQGDEVSVGPDVELPSGAGGAVRLDLSWKRPSRPVRVDWSAEGRVGRTVLPPEGGRVDTGPGEVSLVVSAGPDVGRTAVTLDVVDDDTLRLGASMDVAFDAGNRALMQVTSLSERSRSHRVTNDEVVAYAAASGVRLLVQTPHDDIASNDGMSDALAPWIDVRAGSLTTGPGWDIASWPWSESPRKAGHGAVAQREEPLGAHSVAGGTRFSMVDLGWVDAADTPPSLVEVPPDMLRLDGVDDISAWLSWLNAGADLLPMGPLAWVDVDDVGLMSGTDVEHNAFRGRLVATTGPLVVLSADGFVPGDVVPSTPVRQPGAVATLEALGELDEMTLIVDGTPIGTWPAGKIELVVRPEKYLLATGRSATGDWAATGPIWFTPPGMRDLEWELTDRLSPVPADSGG